MGKSKLYLKIDTPASCYYCQLRKTEGMTDRDRCAGIKQEKYIKFPYKKPKWCPLIEDKE
jgi:hypothetical protein